MAFMNVGDMLTGRGGLPGIEKAWGGSLYEGSGAGASARQQFKNQLKLQKDAQEFAKWQMGNAHQMEIQDLEAAGLNPVLSADGGGASASVSQGSASGGSSIIDPINAISGIVGTINSAKQTNAEINKINHEIKNIDADTNGKNIENDYNKGSSKNAPVWEKLANFTGKRFEKLKETSARKIEKAKNTPDKEKNSEDWFWSKIKHN